MQLSMKASLKRRFKKEAQKELDEIQTNLEKMSEELEIISENMIKKNGKHIFRKL